ncbi:Uncharacterised protein [Vibrio cholerae]|nr:Uncharacterised protein [Vibrio cholerae]
MVGALNDNTDDYTPRRLARSPSRWRCTGRYCTRHQPL